MTTQQRTMAQDWRGIRHARMSPSTLKLSKRALACLVILRLEMKDGECQVLSTRDAGIKFDCAPTTASGVLKELAAAGCIERTPCGLTWLVTLLPPPELDHERAQPARTPAERSDSGQSENHAPEPSQPAEPAPASVQNLIALPIIDSYADEAARADALPPANVPANEPVEQALYQVCKIDPRICTTQQQHQVRQTATKLRQVGATPDDVRRAASYFRTHDWRGRKGETPTPAVLREIWGEVPRATPTAAPALPASVAEPTERLSVEQRRAILESYRLTRSA